MWRSSRGAAPVVPVRRTGQVEIPGGQQRQRPVGCEKAEIGGTGLFESQQPLAVRRPQRRRTGQVEKVPRVDTGDAAAAIQQPLAIGDHAVQAAGGRPVQSGGPAAGVEVDARLRDPP